MSKRLNQTAVDNFLASLDGLSYQEAVANRELDARLYRWSHETVAAIRVGICKALERGEIQS